MVGTEPDRQFRGLVAERDGLCVFSSEPGDGRSPRLETRHDVQHTCPSRRHRGDGWDARHVGGEVERQRIWFVGRCSGCFVGCEPSTRTDAFAVTVTGVLVHNSDVT